MQTDVITCTNWREYKDGDTIVSPLYNTCNV